MALEILEFPNTETLAREAARRFVAAIPPRAEFLVALSGGRIAKAFYEAIVAEAKRDSRNIDHIHFFFADERCVPPSDPESNFLTARQALFDPLQIRAEMIHRIHGETDDAYAAQEAEAELCRLAPLNAEGQPILDLVILGMGEDGHTASLFPGESDSLIADTAVFRAVTAVKPPPRRITLGYAPLRAARELWVLANGPAKEPVMREILFSKNAPLPLRRVLESNPKHLIFSDIPGVSAFPRNI